MPRRQCQQHPGLPVHDRPTWASEHHPCYEGLVTHAHELGNHLKPCDGTLLGLDDGRQT